MALSRVGIRVNTAEMLEADIKLTGLGNALDALARRSKNVKLPPFRANAVRKLKNMVYALSENIILNMNVNTRVGDIERLMAGYSEGASREATAYRRLYEMRQDMYGLPVDVGYHAGAFQYSMSPAPAFVPEIRDQMEMLAEFWRDFYSSYKLGDVFYIAAQGPAYRYMEMGKIGDVQGIIKPTIDSVMSTYKFDMAAAYAADGRKKPWN